MATIFYDKWQSSLTGLVLQDWNATNHGGVLDTGGSLTKPLVTVITGVTYKGLQLLWYTLRSDYFIL